MQRRIDANSAGATRLRHTPKPAILVLGRSDSDEMKPVIAAVHRLFGQSEIRFLPAAAIPDDGFSPALVIVCQHHPDEFPRADVNRWLSRFPIARWVCCFGLWCESDGRNRDTWPIGIRVPARNALGRLLREREVLRNAMQPVPLTAGREESFEFDSRSPNAEWGAQSTERAFGIVISPDRELRCCFEDRLAAVGIAVSTTPMDAPPDVILFDADPWDENTAGQLRRVRGLHPDAAIIALMNFARPEDERRVIRAGADAVVAKLVDEWELASTITSYQHSCSVRSQFSGGTS